MMANLGPNPQLKFLSYVVPAIIALPVSFYTLGLADKTPLHGLMLFALSPGYWAGNVATQNVREFRRSLAMFGWTALLINFGYWYGLVLIGWGLLIQFGANRHLSHRDENLISRVTSFRGN